MANIIPAILTDDINEIQDKLDKLTEVVEFTQIDLMDGKFVNNTSVKPEELEQIKTSINLEAHLMVEDPRSWLPYLNEDIFQRVYFHIEAVPQADDLIQEIKQGGFEVGLASNPETPIDKIEPFANEIDAVLFMSVNPGWQKQEFIPEVIDKIKEFNHQYPEPDIVVDGGVNELNILEVFKAGANLICVGSAIFSGDNIRDNLEKLKDKLR